MGEQVVHKHIRRVIVAASAVATYAGMAFPPTAHADSPLSAFCADNAAQLQRTHHEGGLDPATWASDPANLARFGFQGAGDIDTLYHQVIDSGGVSSHWSNMNARVEWRCAGQ
ncbi:hypothetical protein PJN16_10355 [Mycobacterium kansasii]